MTTKQIHQYKSKIDYLVSEASKLPPEQDVIRAHLSRYICILVSGYLEVSIRELYTDYAGNQASPKVTDFVSATLSKFQNPNMEKIIQVAAAFDKQFGEDLRKSTEGKLKDGVDSIVSNRNQIAHGQSVGLSLGTLKGYYQCANDVIDIIDDHLNP